MPPDEKDEVGIDTDYAFKEKNPHMPPLGSRVKRGRDWRYENQDDYGPGTVIGHSKRGKFCLYISVFLLHIQSLVIVFIC